MKTATPPIHIERGEDAILYGKDGQTYIDAISSWWVNLHGHAHPHIAETIAKQSKKLEQVIFAGFTHTPALMLADKLLEILPNPFAKVFFSDDGSTAVEVSIKIALQYWYNKGDRHKKKIIAFKGAYHGDTFGAMAVGERGAFNAPFHEHLFEVIHIPIPNKKNIETLLHQFTELVRKGDVATFIFEPLVQGSSGMRMYMANYLDQLLAIAQSHDVLCIADEVMTGFGRTGKSFAIDHLHYVPDIICLSKGITGGFLPLGVTVAKANIYDAFHDDDALKMFCHGHSYTANPLACAAACASIEILQSASCQQRINKINHHHQMYAATIERHPLVTNVRKTGTIFALDVCTKEKTSYFNSIRDRMYHFYLQRGVLLRPLGNVVYIMPPYCIKESELTQIYDVITQSLHHLQHDT